jgi:TonB family protein
MKSVNFGIRPDGIRRVGTMMVQLAALTLIVGMALPAMASNRRSVKMLVTPVYPFAAMVHRIAGPVRLDVTVDPRGRVTEMKTTSGNQALALAAMEAVRQWKYAPSSNSTQESVVINFTPNQ